MTKKETILLRQSVYTAIRTFFKERAYLEVETPRLVASPDMEPTLTYMETMLTTPSGGVYNAALATSPEYGLKKLVGEELPRIFELARVYRNAELFDATHNPEFTLLEWYDYGQTFESGLQKTCDLVTHVARACAGEEAVFVQGRRYPVAQDDWKVVSVQSLFDAHVGEVDLRNPTQEAYDALLEVHGLEPAIDDTLNDRFNRLFVHCVQPILDAAESPMVVAYYPLHAASLSRTNKDGMGERFEIYIGGLELCNAYGELTDPAEQRKRFELEAQERKHLNKRVYPIDEALLAALTSLKEPVFGNALGVERLMMLVSGGTNIKDMLTFAASDLFKNES